MNTQQCESKANLNDTIESILADGRDVRNKIATLISQKAEKYQLNKQGLVALTQTTMDEARAVLEKSLPHDPDAALRQVVDGLGDGLSTAVLASRLTFEEARAHQRAYAEEDLTTLSHDLRTLGELFVDTVSKAAGKFKNATAAEVGAFRSHAEKTAKRLLPSIRTTLATIAEHPLQLGKETIETGMNISTQAVGALFTAIGQRINDASQRLSR